MKKNYLTWAGIIAVVVLAALFVSILLTGTFTILPSATIDPIADRNTGDLMVITGTTNLPLFSTLSLNIVPASQPPDTRKGPGSRREHSPGPRDDQYLVCRS